MKTQRKILQLSYAILFLLALFVFSCKKEKPVVPETKDPCECAREVSADFDILEQSHNFTSAFYTKTDTVLANKSVYFRAVEENAEYTWYIGIDVENGRETFKSFSDQWTGSNIPITLVVKKEPNLLCFPDDDGYDSITKSFHIYERCDTNVLEGNFRVAHVGTTDSFDIQLNLREGYTSPGVLYNNGFCTGLDFYNYDGEGSNCVNMNMLLRRNYRQFKLEDFNSVQGSPALCDVIHAIDCQLNLKNEFSIYYTLGLQSNGDYRHFDLKGRKL